MSVLVESFVVFFPLVCVSWMKRVLHYDIFINVL